MATENLSGSTVIAHFSKRTQAEQAVEDLRNANFRSDQISLAVRSEGTGLRTGEGFESGPASSIVGQSTVDSDLNDVSYANTLRSADEPHSESMWTKIKNFFEGSDETTDPHITDTSRPGPTSNPYDYEYDRDSFSGSLSSLNIPQDRAQYFGYRFSSGEEGAVVVVRAEGRVPEAESILQRNGGDLGQQASNFVPPIDAAVNQRGGETQRVQLLGEILRVHKERIQSGEVRLRKEVVTEQQTIQVPVTREELVIERNPVSAETPATGDIGSDREIRIPLSEERVSMSKQPVVREEVKVGKKSVQETRNVSDRVRHEELKVENEVENRTDVSDVNKERDVENDVSKNDEVPPTRRIA